MLSPDHASKSAAGSPEREAAVQFLLGRINYERSSPAPYTPQHFKLQRMRELLRRLGNPQDGMPIVHLAGTKGKGSTSAMIAAVLTAAGYRTGLYSSPHLERFEERLAVDGAPCPERELIELVAELRPIVEAMDASASSGPTFFELATALALLHFARRGVDMAVLEVGLGGRLDSTNVCQPLVSAITSISFDHTRQLGNTLASIAWEKAGVAKPGVPLVSGVGDPEPREVIRQVCEERGSRLVQLGDDFHYTYSPPVALSADDFGRGGMVDVAWRGGEMFAQARLGLVGRHQGANAAVAAAVTRELVAQGWRIPDAALRDGLAQVVWPARIEVVQRRPIVIIDSAHNVASVRALLETLAESPIPPRRRLVFAASRDKDVRGMLAELVPWFDRILVTRSTTNPRATPPEKLLRMARELGAREARACDHPTAAWQEVKAHAAADEMVCVTGSLFLAAELRAECLRRPIDAAHRVADAPL